MYSAEYMVHSVEYVSSNHSANLKDVMRNQLSRSKDIDSIRKSNAPEQDPGKT